MVDVYDEAVIKEFEKCVWSSPRPIPRGRSSISSSMVGQSLTEFKFVERFDAVD